jgi:hypothetical protein
MGGYSAPAFRGSFCDRPSLSGAPSRSVRRQCRPGEPAPPVLGERLLRLLERRRIADDLHDPGPRVHPVDRPAPWRSTVRDRWRIVGDPTRTPSPGAATTTRSSWRPVRPTVTRSPTLPATARARATRCRSSASGPPRKGRPSCSSTRRSGRSTPGSTVTTRSSRSATVPPCTRAISSSCDRNVAQRWQRLAIFALLMDESWTPRRPCRRTRRGVQAEVPVTMKNSAEKRGQIIEHLEQAFALAAELGDG